MDNFQIETAQNVNIVQNAAGIGPRILAFLIDGIIMVLYLFLAFYAFSFTHGLDRDALIVISVTITLPFFLYHLLWETLWNGRSPGKAAMDLRVVKLDGTRPAFSNYLIRWLLRLVDISLTSGSLALVTILLNGKGQRLGDIAASTTVISEKQTVDFSQIVVTTVPENYVPTYPQVTVFSDREMQKIKNIFMHARQNRNHEVVIRLYKRVAKVMDVYPTEKPIIFLDKVITDYNYYTQQL